jgi:AraC-like DNA-binding protein
LYFCHIKNKHFDTTFIQNDMKPFRKYFDTPNDNLPASLGIQILNVGHHVHPIGTAYPDISHPENYYFDWEKGRNLTEYQLLYIHEGEGNFEANGLKPQKIEAGTIVLLYPGVWHRYSPTQNTGWEEYWVGFTGSYAHYLLEQSCFSPQNPIIKVGFNNEFLETFSKLIASTDTPEDSTRKLASFFLIQMLGIVYASALISKQTQSKKEEIINKILAHIHTNWNAQLNFQEQSNAHNISYVWFRKAFKEILGTSPTQYQLMLKVRKAEQMIKDSNLTLTEIAYATGFESVFYFSKLFKQKMGYNASTIRKR